MVDNRIYMLILAEKGLTFLGGSCGFFKPHGLTIFDLRGAGAVFLGLSRTQFIYVAPQHTNFVLLAGGEKESARASLCERRPLSRK